MKWRQVALLAALIAGMCCVACKTSQPIQSVNTEAPTKINAVPSASSQSDDKAKTQSADTPISYPGVSSLRSIDFRNLDYGNFAVRNGKFGDWRDGLTLKKISFGDVTGDKQEEAIIIFRVDTEGSMGANRVFIFTLEKSVAKVILDWESGDRAEGGLHTIYAKAGQLWVETYGVGTNLDNDNSSELTALCCPKHFTRTRYAWSDEEFRPVGKEKVFPTSNRE